MADPVLAMEGERCTPPTDRQTHGTSVRDRTPLGDPPLSDQGVHYLPQYRLSRAERSCGVRQFGVRMTTQEEEHFGLKRRHRLMAGLHTPCRPRNEGTPEIKILWLYGHNNTILSVCLQVLPRLAQKQLLMTIPLCSGAVLRLVTEFLQDKRASQTEFFTS